MTRSTLRPGDGPYPPGLFDLEAPPSIWVDGELSTAPGVAVVGTRTCTRYGVEIARAFGRCIAEAGWVTVSGLARGIDAAAHRGTIDGGGRGVAVLGSGLDRVYPRENVGLAQELVSLGGAIVSEYPPATSPAKWQFPERNRIIASMSLAVVVVESALKGGAQITAGLAAEIGRPVLAVPGDIGRQASAGTNQLIRDGAIPVFGPEDLVAELSLLTGIGAPSSGQRTEGSIPRDGVEIEALPDLWGCSVKDALVRLGRLEASGELRRYGDRVIPETRV